MGARPRCALVHAAHPEPSAAWEEAFEAGIEELAERFGVRVDRGRVRKGPLIVAVEATGTFPGRPPPASPLRSTAGRCDLRHRHPGGCRRRAGGAPPGSPDGSTSPSRGSPRGWPCGGSRRARSTCRTDCAPISGTCSGQAGSALRSRPPACPCPRRSLPPAAGRGRPTSRSRAATTTSSCSPWLRSANRSSRAAPLEVPIARIGDVASTPGLRLPSTRDGTGRAPFPAGYEHFAAGRAGPGAELASDP